MNDFKFPAEMRYQMGFNEGHIPAYRDPGRFEPLAYENLKQAHAELLSKYEKLDGELNTERRLVSKLESMLDSLQKVLEQQAATSTLPHNLKSLPTVSNIPALVSKDDCQVLYHSKGQWDAYCKLRQSIGKSAFKFGYLTSPDGTEMSDPRRKEISAATYEIFIELFNVELDPVTWGKHGNRARDFATGVLRSRFPEFTCADSDWKVEMWLTAKYPDWDRDVRQKYLIPERNLKRKPGSAESPPAIPTKRRRKTKKDAAAIVPKVEVIDIINLVSDSEESSPGRLGSPIILEYASCPPSPSDRPPIPSSSPDTTTDTLSATPQSSQTPSQASVTPVDIIPMPPPMIPDIAEPTSPLATTATTGQRRELPVVDPLANLNIPKIAVTPLDVLPDVNPTAPVASRGPSPVEDIPTQASGVPAPPTHLDPLEKFPAPTKGSSKRRIPMRPKMPKSLTGRYLYSVDYLAVHPDTTAKEFSAVWTDLVSSETKKDYDTRARSTQNV